MEAKTKNLIKTLKNNEEDFEFYPTSKEMIKPIFDNIKDSDINILDIGCGTCNFKKYYNEFSEEDYKIKYKKAELEAKKEDTYLRKPVKFVINKYYVIEKSKILLNKLDRKTIVLGTDFENEMLIDKPVDIIFCNPPYSEYKKWMLKIISESNCYDIYLVVPERWEKDKQIKDLLTKKEINYKILGSFDFLNAERQARAKVNIVHICSLFCNQVLSSFYRIPGAVL